MIVKEDISLREYLHLLAKRVKDPPCIDEYDEFLIKVWEFFSLRVAAERYYESHRYVAISRNGALPISWELLRDTWTTSGPPEQPISLIAKRNYNDVNSLIGNLRKVLNRVRQKVAIARVQQVDSHCLRWLTRQPGRSAAEKGGSRQEILGVVRVENYNTLENRVLKDFLQRCLGLATMYLRRYDIPQFRDHVNIRAVSRFKNLCSGGLSIPEFDNVREIREFPQPNYVLQQDRLYSKIWSSYCDILRQEDVAEKLWNKRVEIDDLYKHCTSGISLHCSPLAKYSTPLWINQLDGRNAIIENPIWENELNSCAVSIPKPPEEEVQTIDLTFPWDNRNELVYPANHRNARPFIQNPHRPSLEPGETVILNEILRQRDSGKLQDYFRQLHGLLGGRRWIVLVPDDWDANWLERVIRSQPPALTRDRMFLLWRSVAAALGMMSKRKFRDNESLVVADGFAIPFYNAIEIRFMRERGTGRILPQRSSVRLHSDKAVGCTDIRFVLNCYLRDHAPIYDVGSRNSLRIGTGRLSPSNFVSETDNFAYTNNDGLLFEGVRQYLEDESNGKVSYFDERDALSLVVQNRKEEVEFKTLVEHDERSPGGRPYKGKKTRGGALQMGATMLALNLLEGDQRDDELLKEMKVALDQKTPETTDIFFEAEMTPGQGLANVLFSADFLDKPLPLDLTKLEVSTNTKAKIEREMKRHFPPVMPYVEASAAIWDSVSHTVWSYVSDGKIPRDNGLFAKAQPYWGAVDSTGETSYRLFGEDRYFDDETMSPIDKLKRENVFGNAPGKDLPCDDFPWDDLFSRLAQDWAAGRNVLRLIAWTYRANSDVFERLRKQFHRQYVRNGMPLSTVEATFCANSFADGDPRIADFVQCLLSRAAADDIGENEMRLLYNLMQFHPGSLESADSDLCERAFMRLYRIYNTHRFYTKYGQWGGGAATKTAGYLLKCMLFMLHRRRFDPEFLKRAEDWQPNGFLAESLPTHTTTLQGHEAMRKSFLNYVRGHGTIDGIPLGD